MVRNDDDWQGWKIPQLVEPLENWTCRNLKPLNHKPLSENNRTNPYRNSNKVCQTNQRQVEYVYWKKPDHKRADFQTVKTNFQRIKSLSEKKLCFSSTNSKHRVGHCHSLKTCLICKNKHHSSICDEISSTSTEPLLITTENNVIYPIVIVKINWVKCRALLHRGSGSSYASEGLLDYLKINPTTKENYRDLNKFNY